MFETLKKKTLAIKFVTWQWNIDYFYIIESMFVIYCLLSSQIIITFSKILSSCHIVLSFPYLATVCSSLNISSTHLVVFDSAVQVGWTITDLVLDHRETGFLQGAIASCICNTFPVIRLSSS